MSPHRSARSIWTAALALLVFSGFFYAQSRQPKPTVPASSLLWQEGHKPPNTSVVSLPDSLSRTDSLMLLLSQTRQKIRLKRIQVRLR